MLTGNWRKPARSTYNGNCLEAAARNQAVLVRDSKLSPSPVLAFTPAAWNAFLARVKGP